MDEDKEYDKQVKEAIEVRQQYNHWRQEQAPGLYDLLVAQGLEWPSLTASWLPGKTASTTDPAYSVHQLIVGTHTGGSGLRRVRASAISLLLCSCELVVDLGCSRDREKQSQLPVRMG